MEGVETIQGSPFDLNKLTTVYLPKSLKIITSGVFNWCSNLKAVYFSTNGWQLVTKRGMNEEYKAMDFSDPYTAAELLRKRVDYGVKYVHG